MLGYLVSQAVKKRREKETKGKKKEEDKPVVGGSMWEAKHKTPWANQRRQERQRKKDRVKDRCPIALWEEDGNKEKRAASVVPKPKEQKRGPRGRVLMVKGRSGVGTAHAQKMGKGLGIHHLKKGGVRPLRETKIGKRQCPGRAALEKRKKRGKKVVRELVPYRNRGNRRQTLAKRKQCNNMSNLVILSDEGSDMEKKDLKLDHNSERGRGNSYSYSTMRSKWRGIERRQEKPLDLFKTGGGRRGIGREEKEGNQKQRNKTDSRCLQGKGGGASQKGGGKKRNDALTAKRKRRWGR